MDISVALVEGLVDPEILRELRLLTEYMVDESLHFMDTPETVVRLAQRDVDDEKASPEYQMKKRSDLLTFRDALLNRLAKMRSRRMNRPKREVLQEFWMRFTLAWMDKSQLNNCDSFVM